MERTRKLGSKIRELIILPIYSSLPSDMQVYIHLFLITSLYFSLLMGFILSKLRFLK